MRTPESAERTLVLVGKTGNGKSATGNTIIGRQVFDSMLSFAGVTSSCQMATTTLADGRIINVIDTPGLFDPNVEPHVVAKEIANCLTLAKDGIHAVLLILSMNRFSPEEMSAFEGLQQIFGDEIADYMIVVFTHGDMLKNQRLDDYLNGAPEHLKTTLRMCGNRRVLFDNNADDKIAISQQKKQLLYLVDDVVDSNDGMPYTNDLFDELQVESRLMESIKSLEKQLEEERAARQKAELYAQEARKDSKKKVDKLVAALDSARLEAKAKVKETESKAKDEMKHLTKRLSDAEKRSLDLDAALRNRPNCAIM